MDLKDAELMVYKELRKYPQLKYWGFEWTNKKTVFGVCNYARQKILLSTALVLINDEKTVRNTILHEIAHALTPEDGHGRVWRKKFVEMGGDGEIYYNPEKVKVPSPKYEVRCTCGRYRNFYRRPKYHTYLCKCGNEAFLKPVS